MRPLASRVTAGLVDQAAYSIQNFAIAFTALHQLTLLSLGGFTLAMTLTILALVTLRALSTEPLSIRFSGNVGLGAAAGGAAGFNMVVAAAVLLPAFLVGLLLTDAAGNVVVAAAIAFIPIVIQDTWRFALFAAQRTWAAAWNDGVVCLSTIAALAWAIRFEHVTPPTLLLIWGAGTAIGALLGAWQLRTLPKPRLARAWLRAHRDIGLPLMGSVLAQQSMGRLSLIIISVLAGVAQLGLVNAARTVLSPVNTLIAATYSFAVPEAVRRRAADPSMATMVRFTALLGLTLAGTAVILTAALLLLPERVGSAIGGQNWDSARSLLIPTCLWVVGVALSQGPRVGLRVLERTATILRLTLLLGLILLIATTVGTLVDGGRGAAWGFGVASLLGQPAWWWTYARARRANPASRAATSAPNLSSSDSRRTEP